MNEQPFEPRNGLIFVRAEATGPIRSGVLNLVLDTGATQSLINLNRLVSLGFDPDQSARRVTVATGSAVEVVPLVILTRFSALGQHRFGFSVLGHDLPERAAVDGLLGLDFFRRTALTIDFREGQLRLA